MSSLIPINTYVDLGKRCVTFSACRRADFFEVSRTGELNSNEPEGLVTIIPNPTQFKTPLWFLTVGVSKKRCKVTAYAGSTRISAHWHRLRCYFFSYLTHTWPNVNNTICSPTHLSGMVATQQGSKRR
ncbi:hypothetical protein EDB92DRAFT_1068702 [Lactarius akahatsu]|uniref:Uncharacterized protein n=1 Tax=Lactarius akahatsu TaxID=416441 RepID=A0AAD4LCJ0_9AGAM|nr:hypothetical protein EDB92DRAFT_1068702 [Lactarius akahatsu]